MKRSPYLAAIAVAVVALGAVNAFDIAAAEGPLSSTTYLTHLAAMGAVVYLLFAYGFPLFIGRGKAPGQVPAPTGRPLVENRCGGRIGMIWFGRPLIKVVVYQDRLVVRPALMGARTVMGHEVTSLQPTGTLLGSALVIHHTNPGTATPIRLQDRSNALEPAISAMTAPRPEHRSPGTPPARRTRSWRCCAP